jgi:hypothetical protein
MQTKFLFLGFLTLSVSLLMTAFMFKPADKLAGTLFKTSLCASGGDDYYFFEDNNVMAICSGCEDIVLLKIGKSKELGKGKVQILWEKVYRGKPAGNVTSTASINFYDNYKAVCEKSNEKQTLQMNVKKTDGCEVIERHDKKFDVQAFLRTSYIGSFIFASEREVSEEELKKMSKAELGIMRNDIFARYGYSFKSQAVKDYLSKQKNYSDRKLSDVSAFLSEIEKQNIEKIKAEESRR